MKPHNYNILNALVMGFITFTATFQIFAYPEKPYYYNFSDVLPVVFITLIKIFHGFYHKIFFNFFQKSIDKITIV